MFKAFSLDLHGIESYDIKDSKYLEIMQKQKISIIQKIQQFKREDGFFDGAKMQADWFPNIEGNIDIFISHSHEDEKSAIALAAFLYDKFNLVSFIDSLVWKNSTDLLKLIDNEFCKNDGENTYDYALRNQSTSHVYMMLTVALTEMIDKCECLFFLNTPESVTPYDSVQDGTISPWIFSEISMAKLIRQKFPKDHRSRQLQEKIAADSLVRSYITIKYDLPTGHLITLSYDDIRDWHNVYRGKGIHALDALYELKGIIYE